MMKVYFGGTFDPVHKGHIQLANELVEHLKVDQIYLVPSYQAVHKKGVMASAQQRICMLKIATQAFPHLLIDEREVSKKEPSYTYHTLSELRSEYPDESLCFVMGLDSFTNLSSWFKVEDFCQLVNLIVLDRPSSVTVKSIADARATGILDLENLAKLGFKRVENVNELELSKAGLAYFAQLSKLIISSSEIRTRLKNKQSVTHLLDDAVSDFIKMHHLYLN